jgi:hypothetical protein
MFPAFAALSNFRIKLSDLSKYEALLKLDNLQPDGSFKKRGNGKLVQQAKAENGNLVERRKQRNGSYVCLNWTSLYCFPSKINA